MEMIKSFKQQASSNKLQAASNRRLKVQAASLTKQEYKII
jgi:hypothetical protein